MARTGAQHTLNLGLDVVDGVGGLHLQGDGLAGESLDEDLCREDMSAAAMRWRDYPRGYSPAWLRSYGVLLGCVVCRGCSVELELAVESGVVECVGRGREEAGAARSYVFGGAPASTSANPLRLADD